jgi:hypothetical protein
VLQSVFHGRYQLPQYTGELRKYEQRYLRPVVLGQVQSTRNADFLAFFSHGKSPLATANLEALRVGMHVGESPTFNATKLLKAAKETLGYIVVERGNAGVLGGYRIYAAVGTTQVVALENTVGATGVRYTFNSGLTNPRIAIASQATVVGGACGVHSMARPASVLSMSVGTSLVTSSRCPACVVARAAVDGSWGVIVSPEKTEMSSSQMNVAVDEDTIGDAERGHLRPEAVSYVLFDGGAAADPSATATPSPTPTPVPTPSPGCYPGTVPGRNVIRSEVRVVNTTSSWLYVPFVNRSVPAPPCGAPIHVRAPDVRRVCDGVAAVHRVCCSYTSPVVVCTPIIDPRYRGTNAYTPMFTVRLRLVDSKSMEVKASSNNRLNSFVQGARVSCLIVEEGVYNTQYNGVQVKMEAVKYASTIRHGKNQYTAATRNYDGEPRKYQQKYKAPVVLGQVMTTLSPNHTAFFSRGNSISATASSVVLRTGMHVGESQKVFGLTDSKETIGYIVLEKGLNFLGGFKVFAGLTRRTVVGLSTNPLGSKYLFTSGLALSSDLLVATQATIAGEVRVGRVCASVATVGALGAPRVPRCCCC